MKHEHEEMERTTTASGIKTNRKFVSNTLTLITADLLRHHNAYYSDDKLTLLFPYPRPLVDVLTLREGPWAEVTDKDRIWVAVLPDVLPDPVLRCWLASIVQRALARIPNPDVRSLAVIPALKNDQVSRGVVDAAWAATSNATSTAASAAASAAEWAVVRAEARVAASTAASTVTRDAAWAAASDAEYKTQIVDLLDKLEPRLGDIHDGKDVRADELQERATGEGVPAEQALAKLRQLIPLVVSTIQQLSRRSPTFEELNNTTDGSTPPFHEVVAELIKKLEVLKNDAAEE